MFGESETYSKRLRLIINLAHLYNIKVTWGLREDIVSGIGFVMDYGNCQTVR